MPPQIWVVLIPAVASITVAAIALVRQVLTEHTKRETARTARRNDETAGLLREYRKYIALKDAEADKERALRLAAEAREEHLKAEVARLEGETR